MDNGECFLMEHATAHGSCASRPIDRFRRERSLCAAGHDLTLIDVRADGVPADELKLIEKAVGWEKLLNTRSTTWRGLSDADKADIDAAKAIALMFEHPTLIKRPVIKRDALITVGWSRA